MNMYSLGKLEIWRSHTPCACGCGFVNLYGRVLLLTQLYCKGVTTILAVLTFATAGQDEVKGSSTILCVGQAVKQL